MTNKKIKVKQMEGIKWTKLSKKLRKLTKKNWVFDSIVVVWGNKTRTQRFVIAMKTLIHWNWIHPIWFEVLHMKSKYQCFFFGICFASHYEVRIEKEEEEKKRKRQILRLVDNMVYSKWRKICQTIYIHSTVQIIFKMETFRWQIVNMFSFKKTREKKNTLERKSPKIK